MRRPGVRMKMFEVVEYNTSKHRASHGVEVQRKPRGAVHLPRDTDCTTTWTVPWMSSGNPSMWRFQ